MIALTLDLSRIDKERIFVGKTGKKYLSFVLIDGPDQFGNDGKVVQSISKEERLAGVKGEICGNWRHLGAKKTTATVAEEKNLFVSPADLVDYIERKAGASTNMNPLPRCVRFKLHRPHNARATWPRGPGSISSPLYPKTRVRMSSKSLVWTSPGNSRDCTSAQLELDLFYETHK
jgi:hypothetical protein